ncbi:Flp family type IVb pilin [Pseudothioclava nitratireducens]|uniref:Flp family type IVb pilin n=1 Tax=Pseudothioclava nitratireducens TaxID=1928646 RepID=UPI0023DCCB56|nr:hypothetical protein [Defluviimonas nitratireducens]MDF1619632.1 hypothetical protein [Defluviimonas nitratireducens]
MKSFVLKTFSRLRKDEDGVTLVEYGIALSLALALGTTALLYLASDVQGSMDAAGEAMPDATTVPVTRPAG